MNSKDLLILERGENLANDCRLSTFPRFTVSLSKRVGQEDSEKWHCHSSPMLSYVLFGSNREFREHKVHERKTGMLNFYSAFEPHKNQYRPYPSMHIGMEFEMGFLEEFDHDMAAVESAVHKRANASLIFLQILKESDWNDVYSEDIITMLLLDFFNSTKYYSHFGARPFWLRKLLEVVHDRWSETLALQDLAKMVQVHPVTISKGFRKHLNCTLGEYQRKLKVQKALGLLKNSDQSICQTALQCGFSDQSHFTRTFKTFTGYLPKEYSKL